MKTKEEIAQAAIAVFESHPDAKALYGTSDGELFFKKEQAELHASQLGLTVELVNRRVEKAATKVNNSDSPSN